MTKNGQALTAANIRYLLVILELDTEKQGVRGSDIAKQLGVTKPSVFAMSAPPKFFPLKSKKGAVRLLLQRLCCRMNAV